MKQKKDNPCVSASLVAEVCELAILVPASKRDVYIYLWQETFIDLLD